jgi:hypothetical protein
VPVLHAAAMTDSANPHIAARDLMVCVRTGLFLSWSSWSRSPLGWSELIGALADASTVERGCYGEMSDRR